MRTNETGTSTDANPDGTFWSNLIGVRSAKVGSKSISHFPKDICREMNVKDCAICIEATAAALNR
jgi:hypothetical protein